MEAEITGSRLNEDKNDLEHSQPSHKSEFVSLICFNSIPILPPVMTDKRREEMNMYRRQAILREMKRCCRVQTLTKIQSMIKEIDHQHCTPFVEKDTVEFSNALNIGGNSGSVAQADSDFQLIGDSCENNTQNETVPLICSDLNERTVKQCRSNEISSKPASTIVWNESSLMHSCDSGLISEQTMTSERIDDRSTTVDMVLPKMSLDSGVVSNVQTADSYQLETSSEVSDLSSDEEGLLRGQLLDCLCDQIEATPLKYVEPSPDQPAEGSVLLATNSSSSLSTNSEDVNTTVVDAKTSSCCDEVHSNDDSLGEDDKPCYSTYDELCHELQVIDSPDDVEVSSVSVQTSPSEFDHELPDPSNLDHRSEANVSQDDIEQDGSIDNHRNNEKLSVMQSSSADNSSVGLGDVSDYHSCDRNFNNSSQIERNKSNDHQILNKEFDLQHQYSDDQKFENQSASPCLNSVQQHQHSSDSNNMHAEEIEPVNYMDLPKSNETVQNCSFSKSDRAVASNSLVISIADDDDDDENIENFSESENLKDNESAMLDQFHLQKSSPVTLNEKGRVLERLNFRLKTCVEEHGEDKIDIQADLIQSDNSLEPLCRDTPVSNVEVRQTIFTVTESIENLKLKSSKQNLISTGCPSTQNRSSSTLSSSKNKSKLKSVSYDQSASLAAIRARMESERVGKLEHLHRYLSHVSNPSLLDSPRSNLRHPIGLASGNFPPMGLNENTLQMRSLNSFEHKTNRAGSNEMAAAVDSETQFSHLATSLPFFLNDVELKKWQLEQLEMKKQLLVQQHKVQLAQLLVEQERQQLSLQQELFQIQQENSKKDKLQNQQIIENTTCLKDQVENEKNCENVEMLQDHSSPGIKSDVDSSHNLSMSASTVSCLRNEHLQRISDDRSLSFPDVKLTVNSHKQQETDSLICDQDHSKHRSWNESSTNCSRTNNFENSSPVLLRHRKVVPCREKYQNASFDRIPSVEKIQSQSPSQASQANMVSNEPEMVHTVSFSEVHSEDGFTDHIRGRSTNNERKMSAVIFCKLAAFVKGHLTRRLMKTDKVQNIIQTIQDTAIFAVQLGAPLNQGTAACSSQDRQLFDRIVKQLTAALYDFHEVFFEISTRERMNIIAQHRHNEHERFFKERQQNSGVEKKLISAATLKAMERKRKEIEAEKTMSKEKKKDKLMEVASCNKSTKDDVLTESLTIARHYRHLMSRANHTSQQRKPLRVGVNRSQKKEPSEETSAPHSVSSISRGKQVPRKQSGSSKRLSDQSQNIPNHSRRSSDNSQNNPNRLSDNSQNISVVPTRKVVRLPSSSEKSVLSTRNEQEIPHKENFSVRQNLSSIAESTDYSVRLSGGGDVDEKATEKQQFFTRYGTSNGAGSKILTATNKDNKPKITAGQQNSRRKLVMAAKLG